MSLRAAENDENARHSAWWRLSLAASLAVAYVVSRRHAAGEDDEHKMRPPARGSCVTEAEHGATAAAALPPPIASAAAPWVKARWAPAGTMPTDIRTPPPTHPLVSLQPAWWALAVAAAFSLAYLWTYRLGTELWPSFRGTYAFGPFLWTISAAVSYSAWKRARVGEEERNMLGLAAIVGLFTVAVTLLAGTLAGMGHSPYLHSPFWLLTNGFYAGAPLLAFEFTRAYVIRSVAPRHPTIAIAGTALVFTALGFSYQRLFGWSGGESETIFWGSGVLPGFASNILASFLVYLGGPYAAILYRGVVLAYEWFSPVLAAPPWLTTAFIGVATPALALWVLEGLSGELDGEADDSRLPGLRLRAPSTAWVLTAVASLGILWFTFGFFGVKPSFIPGHSMEPTISAGSIVVTKNVDPRDVRMGDVILYDLNGTQVLHRVIEVTADGTFSTKGDHNNTPDPSPVSAAQIRGRLVIDVPYVGWVPIWASQGIQRLVGHS